MPKTKVSEMVVGFAGDFIGMGETPDERANLLKSACTAWNIACAPATTRKAMLEHFLVQYRKCNPGIDAEELRDIRQDMELLIKQKIMKYPHAIKQIVSCELTVVDGKDQIFIASARSIPVIQKVKANSAANQN
jgi:hypothetical protein